MPDLTGLREKSKVRVDASGFFAGIKKLAGSIQQPIPLDAVGFKNFFARPGVNTSIENSHFTVTNTMFDASLLSMDPFRRALNEKSIKEIRESSYIQETYQIMLDYLNLIK